MDADYQPLCTCKAAMCQVDRRSSLNVSTDDAAECPGIPLIDYEVPSIRKANLRFLAGSCIKWGVIEEAREIRRATEELPDQS